MSFGFGFSLPAYVVTGGRFGLGASLLLDFTSGNNALDPRITFSRTTNATLTDSTGTLVYAPHNLLVQSESFDSSSWTKTNVTATANTTVAPDGATTADKLVEASGSSAKSAFQNGPLTAGTLTTLSFFVKQSGRDWCYVRVGGTVNINAYFNLATGTVGTVNSGGTASIIPVGDDWYRCSLTVASGSTGSFACAIGVTNADNTTTYTGDGTSGLFIWGAQLNVSTLQPYNPTTVRNLLGFTQEFDNAAYTKTNSTITANATAAPDGSVTADTLTDSLDGAATSHSVNQSSAFISGTSYTLSVYAKQGSLVGVAMLFPSAAFTSNITARFNLATGAVAASDPGVTASITFVGNGWYRCSATATATTSATAFLQIRSATATAAFYQGNGAGTIFIWGAQLSDSASLDPYVYNPAAAPASTAYFGPRFDYDPSTLAARGLLIEEQRTNSIRNNTMVGAVAGTPGTLPTNWGVTSGGVAANVIGTGTENGITYIDIQFVGTTSTTTASPFFETTSGIAAASGQTWTNSVYLRLVGGSLTNVTQIRVNTLGYTSGGVATSDAFNSANISGTLTATTLNANRQSLTATLADATTAFVRPRVFFNWTSGVSVDFTLRIGLPQLELGAFSTSVIPTSTAAATRTADVATMVGDNFANWYSQSEGTLFGEFSTGAFAGTLDGGGTARGVACVSDGTANNRIRFGALLSSFVVASGGSTVANILVGSPAANTIYKIAGGYKQDSFQFANSGALGTEDTSGAVPVGVNAIRLGVSLQDGTGVLNSYIRRISYFPRRVSNAELQALTT